MLLVQSLTIVCQFFVIHKILINRQPFSSKEKPLVKESLNSNNQPQGYMAPTAQRVWQNKQLVVFAALSLFFTLWYCREFIFSSSTTMVGIQTTDAFQSLSIVVNNVGLINSGQFPFGTFWVPNFYGGSVATFYNVSNIPNIPHTAFLVLNLVAQDPVLWLKIFVFAILLISQFCSYKLAMHYFKNRAITWVISIGYSFCTFYLLQINDGHIGFILGAALMPAAFLLLEKLFSAPTRKNMLYLALALIALFLGDLQVTMFAIYYILLRVMFQLFVCRSDRGAYFKRLLEAAILFILTSAPFLISFTLLQNTQALSVTEIPNQYLMLASEFFMKGAGNMLDDTTVLVGSVYVGISLLVFAILPIVFSKTFLKTQSRFDQKNYLFHLLILVFFFLIAIGTPLSELVTTLFVRVPSRTQLVVVLSLCICFGYGALLLGEVAKQRLHRVWRNKKLLSTLLAFGLAAMVFVDVTVGVVPVTSTTPSVEGGARFIEKQPGDFRILSYPLAWAYTNYQSSLIGHEIVGESVIALRYYPTASGVFEQLSKDFKIINRAAPPEAANFTLLSTICAVKYVLINMTSADSAIVADYFDNASQYFAQAYRDDNSVVYENLYFKGTAFAVKDNGQPLSLDNLTLADFTEMLIDNATVNFNQDLNNIELSGSLPEPAYIVISQSYSSFWVQASNGTAAFTKFLNVTAYQADSGDFKVEAVFSAASQTMNLYAVFFTALILSSAALIAATLGKKAWLRLTLVLSAALGVVTMMLAFMGTSWAPQSLQMLGVFSGVFNNVLLLVGGGIAVVSIACLLWSRLLLTLNRTLVTIRLFLSGSGRWVMAQKVVFCLALICSLALIVLAFYPQAIQTDVFRPQQQFIDGDLAETYVSVGTQFSLSGSSTALLMAALAMFASVGLAVGNQFYSEIKSGVLTTKAVEFLGLLGLSAAVIFVVGNGGLLASADLINNQLVAFFAVTLSLVIIVAVLILYHPIVLSTVSAAQKKIVAADAAVGLLLKTLIGISFFFIILVNVTSAFPEGISWLDDNMAYVMVSILLLYIVSRGAYFAEQKIGFSTAAIYSIKRDRGIKRLHLGIFGGIIGIVLASVLMRVLTLQTQDIVSSALVLCGALGGLGFGALTNGDRKLRGIIGCLFGAIAIIFGLVMTYTAPIIAGYSFDGTPLYKWQAASLGQFIGNQLFSLHGIFYLFLGLMLAYIAAAYLSYRAKAECT